nr:zinc finger, RING/FYVE/PHD-type [Tanacetum cinerariifolium]
AFFPLTKQGFSEFKEYEASRAFDALRLKVHDMRNRNILARKHNDLVDHAQELTRLSDNLITQAEKLEERPESLGLADALRRRANKKKMQAFGTVEVPKEEPVEDVEEETEEEKVEEKAKPTTKTTERLRARSRSNKRKGPDSISKLILKLGAEVQRTFKLSRNSSNNAEDKYTTLTLSQYTIVAEDKGVWSLRSKFRIQHVSATPRYSASARTGTKKRRLTLRGP